MARVIAHELRIFGVHGMAVRHYDAMLSAIASGALRPGELVAKTIALEEVGEELASMGRFAQEGVTVTRQPFAVCARTASARSTSRARAGGPPRPRHAQVCARTVAHSGA